MESDETAKPATVCSASSRSYYTRSKRQTRAKVDLDELKLQVERNKVAVEKGKLNLERIKHERARWWQEDNLVDQRLRWCHRPAHRSHLMIGTMEPGRDRHIGATP